MLKRGREGERRDLEDCVHHLCERSSWNGQGLVEQYYIHDVSHSTTQYSARFFVENGASLFYVFFFSTVQNNTNFEFRICCNACLLLQTIFFLLFYCNPFEVNLTSLNLNFTQVITFFNKQSVSASLNFLSSFMINK